MGQVTEPIVPKKLSLIVIRKTEADLAHAVLACVCNVASVITVKAA